MTALEPREPEVLVGELVTDEDAGAAVLVKLTDVAGLPRGHPHNPATHYLNRLAAGSRPAMESSLATIAALGYGLTRDRGESPKAFTARTRAAAFTLPWWVLRYDDTARLRKALTDRYRPATANRHLSALRGVLKECWRLRLMNLDDYQRAIDLDPVEGRATKPARALTQGNLKALFKACAADPRTYGRRDAALLAVLYAGGLRCNEALELDVGDYTLANGRLNVEHGKRHQQRLVYLDNGGQDALAAWLEVRNLLQEPDEDGRHPLFVSIPKGGRLSAHRLMASRVNRILRERAHQAGLSALTAHDLRRALGGSLLDAGVDLSTVQKMLGHANPETTANHYDPRGERTKQDAAEQIHTPYVAPAQPSLPASDNASEEPP
jgi:site-specific recombinase XerD